MPGEALTGCPHGYVTKASCYDCMLDGPVFEPMPTTWQRAHVFNAAFPGLCADCGLPLLIGETIQTWVRYEGAINEERRYTHQEGCSPS